MERELKKTASANRAKEAHAHTKTTSASRSKETHAHTKTAKVSQLKEDHEYKLTMNSSQARTVLKAVELLMRLKINQPKEIIWNVMDTDSNRNHPDFFDHRQDAEKLLVQAFDHIFYLKLNKLCISDSEWKDAEWYRLYNTYQVMRKALHDAENPDGDGIDSCEPLRFTEEPLPGMEWR